MKLHLLGLAIALIAIVGTRARAAVIVDTFSGVTLDPIWTLDDEPASYSGGGFAMDTVLGLAGFSNVGNNAFAHIQTATTYDATTGIRADAIMAQNSPLNYMANWGMSVTIYFDADNWVSLKQMDAGGQYGWGRYARSNGTLTYAGGNTQIGLRNSYLISGVELTDTQIKFYGSSIDPKLDMYGVTDIDANVSVISELTMARPAQFTGQALVILGKGYTGAGYPNPDFDNSAASDLHGFSGIDYARITAVPEPTAMVLLAFAIPALGFVAKHNWSRRCRG